MRRLGRIAKVTEKTPQGGEEAKVTQMTKDLPTGRDFLRRKMFCCNSFILSNTQSPHPKEKFTSKSGIRHCL